MAKKRRIRHSKTRVIPVSTVKMRTLDRVATERFGIPSLVLMENAGRGLADAAEWLIKRTRDSRSQLVLIVCGSGNNGGDGFAAARHMANRGWSVFIGCTKDTNELKGDARTNCEIVRKMKLPLFLIKNKRGIQKLKQLASRSRLIVDALFGVGLERPITGIYADIVSAINKSEKPVLSADLPSGIQSDSGHCMGGAVRADVTVAMGAIKKGMLQSDGKTYCGKIMIADISLPRSLFPGKTSGARPLFKKD